MRAVAWAAAIGLAVAALPAHAQWCTDAELAAIASSPELPLAQTVCERIHELATVGQVPVSQISASPVAELSAFRDHCRVHGGAPCPLANVSAGLARRALDGEQRFLDTLTAQGDRAAEHVRTRAALLHRESFASVCVELSNHAQTIEQNISEHVVPEQGVQALSRLRTQCALALDARDHDFDLVPTQVAIARLSQTSPNRMSDEEFENEVADRQVADDTLVATGAVSSSAQSPLTPNMASDPVVAAVDVILQGLAQFLAARASAEVQAFVIVRLRDQLCIADSDPRRLLPGVCAFLSGSDFDFNASLGDHFVAAILTDLTELPQHVLDLLARQTDALDESQPADVAHAVELRFARMFLTGAIGIMRGETPRGLAHRIRAALATGERPSDTGTDLVAKFDRSLSALEAIATIVAARADAPRWEEVRTLVINAMHVSTLSEEQEAAAHALFDDIVLAVEAARAPAAQESSTQTTPPNTLANSERFVHFLMRALLEAVRLADPGNLTRERTLDAMLTHAERAVVAWAAENPAAAMPPTLALATDGISLAQQSGTISIPTSVVRVMSLGVELAGADDADDAAQALEAFSAPVGSWRAKNDHFVISLTGYVGVGGGGEFALGSGGRTTESGGYGGLVGLVGLDFSGPSRVGPNLFATPPSVGGFLSVVDVGALLSFGSATPSTCTTSTTMMGVATTTDTNATGSSCPEGSTERASHPDPISPLQFVAPGAFFRVGLADAPVVFGFGGTVMPWGRTVRLEEAAGSRTEMVPVLRLGAFVAIDVTMLPF